MNKKIKKLLFWCLAIGVVIGIYYCFNVEYGVGLVCIFNKITGLHCSGCGMTRAVVSLMNLDF